MRELVIDEDLAVEGGCAEPVGLVQHDQEVGNAPKEPAQHPREALTEFPRDPRQVGGPKHPALSLDLHLAFQQPVDGGFAIQEMNVLR
jgi:hypothetical protein